MRAKKIKGRKHHALVDSDGRPFLIEPHTADAQERDGDGALLQVSRSLYPFIEKVWADGGYNHECAAQVTSITVEILINHLANRLRRLPKALGRRRLSHGSTETAAFVKDVEATLKSAAAFLCVAAAMFMIRGLAKSD